MRINDLMALSESATGFSGGMYVDELPHLSLDEAVNALPVVIVESQMGFVEARATHNEALVEATISAAAGGYAPDYNPIVEASFEDIKKKIKAFFDKIIKFLRSIIAKLTLQIDKMRMSGHQLYTKYKDSKLLQGKDFKDLTYNGYEFKKGDGSFANTSDYDTDDGVEKLIAKAIPAKFKRPAEFKAAMAAEIKSGSKAESAVKKIIDDLTSVSSADRVHGMAEELCGTKLSSDGWAADMKKTLYGEKVDIKYGQHGFDLKTIGDMLESPDDLSKIKDEYARVEQAAHSYHDRLERAVADIQTDIDRLNADKDDKSSNVNALSLASSYFNAYMGVVSDSYAVINNVKKIKYDYQKARYDQAKGMFGKMLSYKAPKSNNNDAADSDDIDVMMLDFAM